MASSRFMALPRTAQALASLAAMALVLTTAVALLSADAGLPGMHLMDTFGLSRGTAEWIVSLVVNGLGGLVRFLFPFLSPYVDQILALVQGAGFEVAVQW